MKKFVQRLLLILIISSTAFGVIYFLPVCAVVVSVFNTFIQPSTPVVQALKLWGLCVIIVSVIVFLINRLLKYMSVVRYLRSPLSKIDKMTGEEFEFYLKCRFEKSGYKVETTPASNDYGADLICKNKNGVLVVQAKRYEATVGTAAVQEVVAAKEYYEADRCMVVTNSYFTKNAISLAEVNEVELIDRDTLFSDI